MLFLTVVHTPSPFIHSLVPNLDANLYSTANNKTSGAEVNSVIPTNQAPLEQKIIIKTMKWQWRCLASNYKQGLHFITQVFFSNFNHKFYKTELPHHLPEARIIYFRNLGKLMNDSNL